MLLVLPSDIPGVYPLFTNSTCWSNSCTWILQSPLTLPASDLALSSLSLSCPTNDSVRMKGRARHSSAQNLYSYAFDSVEIQESLWWLARPCMGSPYLFDLISYSFPSQHSCHAASPLLLLYLCPPASLFSSCFFSQMVPGPPPGTSLTQMSPYQWGFRDPPFKLHPFHTYLLLSFPPQSPWQFPLRCIQFIWLNCLVSLALSLKDLA